MKKSMILAAVQVLLVVAIVVKLNHDEGSLPRERRKVESVNAPVEFHGRYAQLWLENSKTHLPAGVKVEYFVGDGNEERVQGAVRQGLWVDVAIPKKGPPRLLQVHIDDVESEPLRR